MSRLLRHVLWKLFLSRSRESPSFIPKTQIARSGEVQGESSLP